MTKKVSFEVLGQVVAKANHYMNAQGRIIKDAEIRAYERAFALQAGKFRGARIGEPFRLSVKVYFRSKRSDLDNALKTLLDCLQDSEIITNDNLCMEIQASKGVSRTPKAIICVETLEQTLF